MTDIHHEVREALRHALRQNLEALLTQLLDERITGVAGRRVEPLPPAAPRQVPLSAREEQILQRIGAGDSNKAIARTLNLSLHTVKRHVANVLAKLGVSSRVQAATWVSSRH